MGLLSVRSLIGVSRNFLVMIRQCLCPISQRVGYRCLQEWLPNAVLAAQYDIIIFLLDEYTDGATRRPSRSIKRNCF